MNTPNADIFVSVLAVIGNDADILSGFISETTRTLSENFTYYELLLVDNGSNDGSSERIQDIQKKVPNLRLLRLSRVYEKEIALAASLDNSIGDFVVIIDINRDPPSLIPAMVQQASSGYDVVIAEQASPRYDSWLRNSFRRAFYRLASSILGFSLQPQASYYRLLSRRVVNSLTRIKNKSRYLKYFNALVGFRQILVPCQPFCRREQADEPRLVQSIGSALDIIFSNSARPLRWASWLGLAASSVNLAYFGYIFVVTLVKREIAEGWLTTNVMSTFMFFILFLILTILSEYIARILEETKDRPLYFIDFEKDSPVMAYKPEDEGGGLNVV